METEHFLLWGIIFFAVGAVSALVPAGKSRTTSYLCSVFGALSFLAIGIYLTVAPPVTYQTLSVSSLFAFSLRGDALAGFFMITISLVTLAVSVYSIGFTRTFPYAGYMGFFYNILILSLYAVVLSANIFTFLISWETMAIASYFLVILERDEKAGRAGLFYAVMTHIGTAFIIALFFVLYRYTGRMDFEGMKAGLSELPAGVKSIIFIFAVIGFGTKAGIIPLHTWIPRAYAVVPSNVAALMSGLMVKMGIYGLIRICMDVMGQGPEWWGIALICVGAVSAILGILYSLIENDMKLFLAYSSVENIGIILLGVGAAMMFKSSGLYALSSLALTAALYHVLNHALFKSGLFLGAGSVINSTGSGNMETMGGLLKRMPYTGLFFLVGSLSICALPPLNGFVSEWLTYQSLLLGFQAPSVTAKIVSPLGGAALALTGALAAAGFVKAFGISFLGMPRSDQAREARESSPAMIRGHGVPCRSVPCLRHFPCRRDVSSGFRRLFHHRSIDPGHPAGHSWHTSDIGDAVTGFDPYHHDRDAGRRTALHQARRGKEKDRVRRFMGLRHSGSHLAHAVHGHGIHQTAQDHLQAHLSPEQGPACILSHQAFFREVDTVWR